MEKSYNDFKLYCSNHLYHQYQFVSGLNGFITIAHYVIIIIINIIVIVNIIIIIIIVVVIFFIFFIWL